MRRSFLGSCLRAWLTRVVLGVTLLTGVTPSGGLVLCFEPDGSFALEAVGLRACAGDEEHSCDEDEPRSGHVVPGGVECCECLDVIVQGTGDATRVRPAVAEVCIDPPLACELDAPVSELVRVHTSTCDRRGESPEPPGALAHLRTVVLRV